MFKIALECSLPGILLSFMVPAILGYFVLPLPDTQLANAISCGIDGAVSAGVTSIITLIVFMKKQG